MKSAEDWDIKSWAAIAKHLNVNEKTARIWHRTSKLPIYQVSKRGRVFASSKELDEWKARYRRA